MRVKYSNSRRLRAATLAEADFSIAVTPRDRVVASGSQSTATVGDRVIRTTTSATIAHEADLAGVDTIAGTLLARGSSWTNLTPSIATLDTSNGQLTRVADGTASVLLRTALVTRRADVAMSQSASSTAETLSFVPGSLARMWCDQIDNRIAGLTPPNTSPLYTFLLHDTATYIRNPEAWLGNVDYSCLSVWNSGAGQLRAGTLISPRHVIFAKHFPLSPGHVLRFVTAANVTVERTITNTANIATADFTIGKLDSDVPGTIGFAKVLPSNVESYLTQQCNGACVVVTDQDKKTNVSELGNLNAQWFNQFPPASHAQRLLFNEPPVNGDSGCPMFVVMNNALILVSTITAPGAGVGDAVHQHLAEINAAMTALGGGYQVTQVSLAGFPTYS